MSGNKKTADFTAVFDELTRSGNFLKFLHDP